MVEVQILKTFDVEKVRLEFPALDQEVYGRRLIYFDNGATSQKPKQVIDAIRLYYEKDNANIHRGVHYLSQIATEKYEEARRIIQKALNAESEEEIIFTKGTTDGINLLAFSLGETLEKGDEIIISEMEHHSNIVPWQMLCERKGCVLKVVPINDKGELVMEEYKKLLSSRTKIVSITHISNSLGTINPIQEIIRLAHDFGAQVVIDGAQSMQHLKVDVQVLNCDYFVFSGHKVFGPTGIGVLYGKKSLLEKLPPYQGGGDMIEKVSFEKTSYNVLPFKFEAGTPNIEGAICLGEAFRFLNQFDFKELKSYEDELLRYAQDQLKSIEGLRIIGEAQEKASVISFVVEGLHPFDVGTLLDKQGIAVRTGHHCTQPLMDRFQIPGTIRASFAFYNTKAEIDQFVKALNRSIEMLR
jgi:cysteine desulfurase / selenocysteine lyase